MKPQPQEKNERANNHPTQHHGQEMNRKPRRGTMRKIQSDSLTLQVLRAKAAGIDMGNESHYGAVPPDRDSQPVRRFGCTPAELREMAGWLKPCGIRTVARQSPGVYGMAVGSMGWRCWTFSRKLVSKCTWSMPGTPRSCRG